FRAREALERSGEHHHLSREWLRALGSGLLHRANARLLEALEDASVAWVLEEAAHRLGHLGSDAADPLQIVFARLEQGVNRFEVIGQEASDVLAHVLDAERRQESIEPR